MNNQLIHWYIYNQLCVHNIYQMRVRSTDIIDLKNLLPEEKGGCGEGV